MPKYDLLIKGGRVVDPANGTDGLLDVALAQGRVAETGPDLNPDLAAETIPAKNMLVLPGLVDSHVHLTPAERAVGFRMLARAGVTCALDCAGPLEEAVKGMAARGSGISVAVLNKLDPGGTISGPDAPPGEVDGYLQRSLDSGALGLKLLGGHLPLNPETTARAIEAANRSRAYVAFHCGTTRHGSNLEGFLEALDLAGTNRLHLCHINAYCRGLTHGSPVEETRLALEALAKRPELISESHLAFWNSCWSRPGPDGLPRSHVTRTCLKAGGYEPSREGVLAAAQDGYLRVQKALEEEMVYLDPEEGRAHLLERDFAGMISFPVNRRSTAFLCATEKDALGRFAVTALSTDGGAIPRNFLLSHGLSLVRFEALSLSEFVTKTSLAPARMLGLESKGHLGPGADGDLVVADPVRQEAVFTVARGRVVMAQGRVVGSGGTIITTERGLASLARQSVPARATNLEASLLYAGVED